MWCQIDDDFVRIISSLTGDPRWEEFKQRIKTMSESMTAQTIHSFPAQDDCNYGSRLDVQRGIAICLDVLQNAMYHASEISEELKQQVEEMKRMENVNKAL